MTADARGRRSPYSHRFNRRLLVSNCHIPESICRRAGEEAAVLVGVAALDRLTVERACEMARRFSGKPLSKTPLAPFPLPRVSEAMPSVAAFVSGAHVTAQTSPSGGLPTHNRTIPRGESASRT
jgi:hypothetical protein